MPIVAATVRQLTKFLSLQYVSSMVTSGARAFVLPTALSTARAWRDVGLPEATASRRLRAGSEKCMVVIGDVLGASELK